MVSIGCAWRRREGFPGRAQLRRLGATMRAAGDDARKLPKDPAAPRALLLQSWRERDDITAERDRATRERDEALAQDEQLLALLAKLQRMPFGPRSEPLPEGQLHFA